MRRIIEEDEILHLDSVIEVEGRYSGMTVKEALSENRSAVMQMLKKGLYFGDDVLAYAGIRKIVKDESYELDYDGIVVYSTKWPDERLKRKKVEEAVVIHDGEREESFYL